MAVSLNVEEVRAVFEDLQRTMSGLKSKVDVGTGIESYSMHSSAEPDRFAQVTRRDMTQFSLVLDGGFYRTQIDEDLSPDEEVALISWLARVGAEYLRNGARTEVSKLLRVPRRVIVMSGEEVVVSRGVDDHVRFLLGRSEAQPR